MFKKLKLASLGLSLLALVLVACSPQTVEVTRVVTETVTETVTESLEVEVTRVIEGETVTETVIVTATPLPATQGGNLVESSFADISTLNPVLSSDNASGINIGLMFYALAGLEPFSGAVVPQIAESWDVSEDGLTYTFHLRDDVMWSDGTQLTANDVAFTFDAINTDSVASPRRSNFTEVESWTAVDDFTLELKLKSVDCTVLSNVGVQGILPAHVYGGDPETIAENAENTAPSVVSGPFTFVEHVADDHVTLAANPGFYLGKPNVDTWTYRVYADQSAELAGMLAGEVDYMSVGPQFVSVIEGQIASGDDLNIQKFFSNGYTFIGYNLANPANPQNGWDDTDGDGKWTEGEPPLAQDPHPVLSDLAVRQAMAHSIDYTGIINKVAFGQGGPTVANVWPSITWAYNNEIEPYAQDLEKAAQMLADAGWVPGSATNDADVPILEKDGVQLTLNLMTNAGNETRENIGVLTKDVLDGLGFNIQLEFIEFGTVVQKLLGQEFDMVIIGFGGGAPEPDDSSQFSYVNDEVGAGFNFVSYYNATVEDNLKQGKGVPGCLEDARAPFYQSNQVEIYNDVPYSFLYIPLANNVWRDRLQGIDPNPWSLRYDIEQWSLEP